MGAHDALLERYKPALRYDSNEQFFADSAAQLTQMPGVRLRRAPQRGLPDAVIASAEPRGSQPRLTLEFLGPKTYANGEPVAKTDVIGVRGKDYAAQYARVRTARPELSNRIYGRAVEAGARLWLQYWCWYFYNDYRIALGFGTHEGDWESVQLRMSIDGDVPDVAVYAQHRHGEKRAWDDVETLPGRDSPVVYVARGSHAAYFEAGYHETEAFYDIADGKRPAPELELEIIGHATHAWMRWPGRWGDTQPRSQGLDLDQSSPSGPGTKRHWRNPDRLLNEAKPSKLSRPESAPDVRLTRGAINRLRIDYDFTKRSEPVSALLVTVNSRDEKNVPPATATFESLTQDGGATIQTDIALDPAHHYDLYASTLSGDPPRPSASRLTEIEPVGAAKRAGLGPRIARIFGRMLAFLRGDRR